jgi:hypothetical protein
MTDPIHTGVVEVISGVPRFVPDSLEFLRVDLEGFIGKRIECTFKETRRQNVFNAYYFVGVVKVFMDHFNAEKTFERVVDLEFVHEVLKSKFLGWTEQVLPGGEIIKMLKSSAKLTVSEFKDYVEYCKEWGGSFFSLTFPDKPKES